MISTSTAFQTANAVLRKHPIFLIQIDTYTRAFTNYPTGVSGQYDWITSIEDNDISVSDLDGGADLGQFVFNVQDNAGSITAEFPTFTFEGKAITIKTGFVGMSQADFALLFTGQIDSVASANQNKEYQFICVDNSAVLQKAVYTEADDGRPTDTDHHRTLNGHPLEILSALLETELGLPSTAYNKAKLGMYEQGLFTGVQFVFDLDSAPVAKDFIENEIMKPLGGYIWTNNKGQLDFNFFRRDLRLTVQGGCLLACFTDTAGVIIGSPFSVGITLGQTLTLQVPPGATKISFGVNDHFWPDNLGGWNLLVNASALAVSALCRPWNTSGVNADFPFTTASSSAPATASVTAGTLVSISYTSGTVSLGPGWPFTDPTGIPGYESNVNGPGQYAIATPLNVTAPNLSFDHGNMEDVPEATQADLVNQITFRFDKTADDKWGSELIRDYTTSQSKYGLFGAQVIESQGLRAGFQGFSVASATAQMIFLRYGLKALQFEEVTAHWTAAVLEPGDLVAVTSDKVPDRVAGVIGITAKLFEVLDRKWDFEKCLITVKLLDATYLQSIGQYVIAPNGVSDFTLGTTYEKDHYMYLCNDSGQYSDTTPGHALG